MLVRPWIRKTLAWTSSKRVQLQLLRPCGVSIEFEGEIGVALESAFKSFQEHPDMRRNLSVGDFLSFVEGRNTRFFQVAEFGFQEHERIDTCLVAIESTGWLALLAEQKEQDKEPELVLSSECA